MNFGGPLALFGLIDTTQDERLYPWLKASARSRCLFSGKLDPVLEQASPFIVQLGEDEPLLDAWLREGWGRGWGIQCTSRLDLLDVRRHFRKFLQAQLPDGEGVLFRFYDPKIWRVYLPTCNLFELEKWFQGIDEFRCENAEGAKILRYSLRAGRIEVKDHEWAPRLEE